MQSITIQAELRTGKGKQAAKALRRAELVPCELYGGKENVHFSVSPKELKNLVYSPDFKLVDIEIEGKKHRSVMRSIQFHPVSEQILHIDFMVLEKNRKIKVEVPIRFEGVAPGVKSGGKLTQKVQRVQIKATPDHLVDQVTLDISKLKLGQSLRIRDIKLGDNIEVLNNPGIPVASITIPRALKSATGTGVEEEGDEETAGDEADQIEGGDGGETTAAE
jgi:large subunit ribosomal protein L25